MMVVSGLLSLLVVQGAVLVVNGAIGGSDPKGLEGTSYVTIHRSNIVITQGVLIDRRWVMVPAFYVDSAAPSELQVKIGEQVVGVDSIMLHPNYTSWDWYNAAAILHLQKPARVGNPLINPVDGLPTPEIEQTILEKDRRCYYFSKGSHRNDGGIFRPNDELKKLSVRFTVCKNEFSFLSTYYKNHLSCLKHNDRGDTFCEDIGAVIMCRHQGQWYATGMLGVRDLRNECHSNDVASVNVAINRQWIIDTINMYAK